MKLIPAIVNILILLAYIPTYAETEFFKSQIIFSTTQLEEFYSPLSIDSNRVYVNAISYHLYSYEKKSQELVWMNYSGIKSNNESLNYQNYLFKRIGGGELVQITLKNADEIQNLKIKEFLIQPIFKDDVMYYAAVVPEIGGAILAYDFKKNEIIWKKYIGHGISFQPYFFKDKMVVNIEDNLWTELDYNGRTLNTNNDCYFNNPEPPFEEHCCAIKYEL
jgi:hypothetical protein